MQFLTVFYTIISSSSMLISCLSVFVMVLNRNLFGCQPLDNTHSYSVVHQMAYECRSLAVQGVPTCVGVVDALVVCRYDSHGAFDIYGCKAQNQMHTSDHIQDNENDKIRCTRLTTYGTHLTTYWTMSHLVSTLYLFIHVSRTKLEYSILYTDRIAFNQTKKVTPT